MAGERIDYTAAAVEAARSVLIELTHILGEYRDDMVLVGGWIPELLIPQSQERHVGSIEVDLALNHKELTEAGYRMIGENNYPGGGEAVVKAFKPHLKLALVKEGLKKIAVKFATLDHVGPKDVAEFVETLDVEWAARSAFVLEMSFQRK